jgi:iron complex transport system permease protein
MVFGRRESSWRNIFSSIDSDDFTTESSWGAHARSLREPSMKWSFYGIGCLAAVTLYLFVGADIISVNALFDPNSVDYDILFNFRFPRLVFLAAVGGVLALLGGIYQTTLHNPLADPYILGVSSASTLAMIAYDSWIGSASVWEMRVAGFAGAFSILPVLMALSFRWGRRASERLLLFGLGANFVLSASAFLLLSWQARMVGGGGIKWLFGNVPWLMWGESLLFLVSSILLTTPFFVYSKGFDALELGDSVARTLGFHPGAIRMVTLSISSILVALIVSMTGVIGFVGLVTPHLCRRFFRLTNLRAAMASYCLMGAFFLVSADLLSRVLRPPFEFPIGIITTLIGGPLFLWVLAKDERT